MANNFIEKQSFTPSFIGIFFNPFFISRKGLYTAIQRISSSINGKTLDVGCGTKPYESLFRTDEYIGLEIDTTINREKKKVDVFYDGKIFPFESQSFDSIITNQVFEHVFNPDSFIKEINRVLKNGGNLLLTVPFVWDEHEQPYDFARYSSFGLSHILNENGFEIIQSIKSVNNFAVIFQLINAYLYKIVHSVSIIRKIFTLTVFPFFSICGLLSSILLPSNNDLYLDNIILARKVKNLSN